MALEIFKLVGSIFVNNEKADESIAKTDKKAQGLGTTLVKGVGTAAKWGAGLATAAGAGVTAITGLATKTAKTADNIDKMSQKIGISRTAYQELDFVMSQSGASVDSLKSGLKALTNQMSMAQDGSATSQKMFDELGVSWDDGTGKLKDQETMMFEAMTALQNMEDQTKKAALANDLFGKAGSEMMPMLNGAAGSIDKMRKQAHDLGLVLSDETVDGGVKFTDTVDQIKRSLGAMVSNLGASVMPLVQSFADFLLANMPMIQSLFQQLAPVIALVFTNLLPPVMQLIETLLPVLIELFTTIIPVVTEIINAILPILIELFNMLLPPIMELVSTLLPPLLEIFKALMPILTTVIELLRPILKLITDLIGPIISLVTSAITPLVNIVTSLINMALKPLIPVIKIVAEVFNSVLGNAIDYIKSQIDNLKGVFNGIITFFKGVFTGNWKQAFEGLKQIAGNIMNGVINVVKYPINSMISLVNGFIRGLNKLKIPDWVPGVGGKGINIPEIPKLAKGGTVYKAGRAVVGEAGAELLDLPAGARVTPLNGSQKALGGEETTNLLLQIIDFLSRYFPEFLEAIKQGKDVYLDDTKVSKKLAPSMSRELASRNKIGARKVGVAHP
ncbi:hypothetical protein I5677_12085 [Mobilitalea sibirica]|uniref:Phage-related protein n=1 Tax=Mobilitalea sibirica TaxID=1462919 RepID=A0A8J7HD45_9FIRM|nr:hypothetical protein [Mobilitalea sibirica]